MRVVEVEAGSEVWRRAVELREEVLRRPIGLSGASPEELSRESSFVHIVALAEDDSARVIGTLTLVPIDELIVRMRLVAVDPNRQREGIGAAMVAAAEKAARDRGFRTMIAHARDVAVPFYERLGYSIDDEPFTEVGIRHFRIEKPLVVEGGHSNRYAGPTRGTRRAFGEEE